MEWMKFESSVPCDLNHSNSNNPDALEVFH